MSTQKLSGIFAAGVIKSVAKRHDFENKKTGEVTEGKYLVQIEVEKAQAEGSIFEYITLGTDAPELYKRLQGQYLPCIFIQFGTFNDRIWYRLDDNSNMTLLPKPKQSSE